MRSRNEELLREALAGVLRKVGVLRSDVDPSSPDLIRMARRYSKEPELPLFPLVGQAIWKGISPSNPAIDDDIPF